MMLNLLHTTKDGVMSIANEHGIKKLYALTLIHHQKNKKPRRSCKDGVLEYFYEKQTNTNEVNILWHKSFFRMNMKLRKANPG